MPLKNPLGDLELSDPQAMRALAHPVRLAILDELQRHGPATATRLSPRVGATPSVASWHLRHLAQYGLVRDSDAGGDRRQRWWEAAASGIRFEATGDAERQAAARVLGNQMFHQYELLPRTWITEVEPHLDEEWRRISGLANTRVVLSPEECEVVLQAIEEVLAPYATRDPEERPSDGRGVRLLRYAMPEAADEATQS